MPVLKFPKEFPAGSLLFGHGFPEGDPEGGNSMSGVGVDRCVGAREPNPVRIQIASATGGGNC